MGFLKQRLFWVVCTVIVLLSIGLLVADGMRNSSNEEELAKIGKDCDRVYSTIRKDAKKVYTNQLNRVKQNRQDVQADAQHVSKQALLTANRPVFYPEVFPKLKDETHRKHFYGNFATTYCDLIDDFLTRINAKDKPSDEEIDVTLAKIHQTEEDTPPGGAPARPAQGGLGMDAGMGMGPGMGPGMPGGMGMGSGRRTSQRTTRGAADAQDELLIEDLRRKRAEEVTLYANRDAFCCYEYWHAKTLNERKTMQVHSWLTQVAAWIQEDVVESIVQINGTDTAVAESPVKRLIEISFGGDSVQAKGGAGYMGGSTARSRNEAGTADRTNDAMQLPCYITKDEDGEPVGDITSSFTGRISGDMFDVVHFSTSVIIDSPKISDFINALQSSKSSELTLSDGTTVQQKRNQITVIQIITERLDVAAENAAGYYYGSGSLCTLRLVCEYVFFRNEGSVYTTMMPEAAQKLFEEEN